MESYRYFVKFHASTLARSVLSIIRNTLNIAWTLIVVLLSPIWWLPVVLLVKIMEPYEKRKRDRAVREHMDRMFQHKNKE